MVREWKRENKYYCVVLGNKVPSIGLITPSAKTCLIFTAVVGIKGSSKSAICNRYATWYAKDRKSVV